ncbi:hypothetical protein RFI_27593 [Reticulomyxa filosa]|uniref:Uncharacterized protein n=1 Tax=Reticulomyxa filosa TaxID=46433 RepID=X6M779_RETFI|nr:hypothetical protein RFI_27593 [Reticulomyxa filosa]|eukprot:ETO09784.1 hypothetical protein RFI_27593 [Reticulomyxa filosa]
MTNECSDHLMHANRSSNPPNVFVGIPLIVNAVVLVLGTVLVFFALYHLFRLSQKVDRVFVWSAIMYHILLYIYLVQNLHTGQIKEKSKGVKKKEERENNSNLFFFLMLVIKLLKTVLVFRESVARLDPRLIRWFYVLLVVLTLLTCSCGIWMSATSNCTYVAGVEDWDITGNKHYDICFIERVPYMLLTASGAVITFVKRNAQQRVHAQKPTPVEVELQSQSEVVNHSADGTDTRNEDGIVQPPPPRKSGLLTSSTPPSPLPRTSTVPSSSSRRAAKNLAHIRKANLIAITSIVSTMVSLFITAVSSGANFVVQIDALLNGVLICCVFTFGNRIYTILFGCCLLQCQKKWPSLNRLASTPTSKSGSDDLEV